MATTPPWFDELREGILLVEEGRVRSLNQTAASFLQVERDRAIGKPLIAVARDHRIERAWLEGTPLELDTRARRLIVRPIVGGLCFEDVTELRTREEEARELLAVLSHELRTPVTTIQSTLEALEGDLQGPQRARFLARARQEGERLVRLLEDLTVDVAPPQARSVYLPELFDRAEALLSPLMAAHRVALSRDAHGLSVWMDPDKLLQIVLNLVENAVVHGPSDSTVELEARLADDGSRVHVAVRDRGAPLDADVFDTLFAPHRRGKSAASGGSGLGLYIVRSIAERAGGAAWGRPLENGNEFAVALPRPAGRQFPSPG